eukprot:gnl/MRDRNA2_/MRDRNA2_89756_c0_seq1.p1 gnl/MRDRNA2_/MRDRNA2_89756_c0~~gnl/MRDRNA2_/MRDRNA2_89756_c0_seq1.p1  ORF type:complete len:164 (-),score=29.55 gnl/MRDRNA2_/MRDRNA2_89756_c0_seq1:303-794(-)
MGCGASTAVTRSSTFRGQATGFQRPRFVRDHVAKAHSGIWTKVHGGMTADAGSQSVAAEFAEVTMTPCETAATKVEQFQLPTLLQDPVRSDAKVVSKQVSETDSLYVQVSSDELESFLQDRSLLHDPVQSNGEEAANEASPCLKVDDLDTFMRDRSLRTVQRA